MLEVDDVAITDGIKAALDTAITGGIVVRHLVIVDIMDHEGNRILMPVHTPNVTSWEVAGMASTIYHDNSQAYRAYFEEPEEDT